MVNGHKWPLRMFSAILWPWNLEWSSQPVLQSRLRWVTFSMFIGILWPPNPWRVTATSAPRSMAISDIPHAPCLTVTSKTWRVTAASTARSMRMSDLSHVQCQTMASKPWIVTSATALWLMGISDLCTCSVSFHHLEKPWIVIAASAPRSVKMTDFQHVQWHSMTSKPCRVTAASAARSLVMSDLPHAQCHTMASRPWIVTIVFVVSSLCAVTFLQPSVAPCWANLGDCLLWLHPPLIPSQF